MNLSLVMLINGIFALVGAVGLLAMPDGMMRSYGASLSLGGIFISQILGVILLGIGGISIMLRNTKDKDTRKTLVMAFLLVHVGSAGLAFQALNTGVLNSMVWFDIIVHGLLAVAFGYFLLGKKE